MAVLDFKNKDLRQSIHLHLCRYKMSLLTRQGLCLYLNGHSGNKKGFKKTFQVRTSSNKKGFKKNLSGTVQVVIKKALSMDPSMGFFDGSIDGIHGMDVPLMDPSFGLSMD